MEFDQGVITPLNVFHSILRPPLEGRPPM